MRTIDAASRVVHWFRFELGLSPFLFTGKLRCKLKHSSGEHPVVSQLTLVMYFSSLQTI